jgi:ABC-type branched-subunit amino acid transport system substrate-binding protein
MFARLTSARNLPAPGLRPGTMLGRALRGAGLAVAALWLAACEPMAVATGPATAPVDLEAPVRVALIVPGGSGQAGDQQLAASLENAARLAVSDLSGVRIDLRVYNDGGSPAQAAAEARRAVEDGAQVILGPVFADAARAAGEAVAGSGVNVLSFSNNPAAAGGNVFILGSTFDNTARRLASYAQGRGVGSVMVVHERNAAGDLGRSAISQALSRAGGQVVATEGFDFSQQGIVEAVPRIVDTARSAGAQGVFFTSTPDGALPLLMQLLPENGMRPGDYQFIGLTRWDVFRDFLALPGAQGGWFALPDPGLTAQFEARYRSAFGGAPVPIAGLAYDGIAAVGALARSGRPEPFGRAGLTQASGFAGVNGAFRLLANGTNERALAVATVRDNGMVVLDPAPRSFVGAGF